jgi:hypothetical protein
MPLRSVLSPEKQAPVHAIELEEIEGVQEGARFVLPPAENLEQGHAPLIAAYCFPIDQAGAHLEVVHGLHDQAEAG